MITHKMLEAGMNAYNTTVSGNVDEIVRAIYEAMETAHNEPDREDGFYWISETTIAELVARHKTLQSEIANIAKLIKVAATERDAHLIGKIVERRDGVKLKIEHTSHSAHGDLLWVSGRQIKKNGEFGVRRIDARSFKIL